MNLCSGLHGEKQDAGSIFDGENYRDVFKRDLLEAERRIVISSQTISGKKGIRADQPAERKTGGRRGSDSYHMGTGRTTDMETASFWMQLHEDMRQAGFFIREAENSCENFAVIDEEIVWYGQH